MLLKHLNPFYIILTHSTYLVILTHSTYHKQNHLNLSSHLNPFYISQTEPSSKMQI